MAWIESHQDLGQHPKVWFLKRELGCSLPEALGILHLLWHFTLKFSWRSGDLSRFGIEIIAQAVCWEREPSVLVAAFQKAGFLDGMIVHDWTDFSGRLIKDRIRYKKSNKTSTKSRRSPAVVPPESVANLTLPNHTLPNQRKGDALAGLLIPGDLVNNEAEIRDWLEYKQQKGQRYKPKGLEALWRRLREIPIDQRRSAVDHSMSNGWSGLFEKKGLDAKGNFTNEMEKRRQNDERADAAINQFLNKR